MAEDSVVIQQSDIASLSEGEAPDIVVLSEPANIAVVSGETNSDVVVIESGEQVAVVDTDPDVIVVAVGEQGPAGVGGNLSSGELTVSKVKISGDVLEINSDASGSGSDYMFTLQRPSSGMTGPVVLTLPVDDGTTGQVLSTDGNGVLSFVSAGSTGMADKLDSTALVFNSSSQVAMFTTGESDVVDYIEVIIDVPFNGNPSISVGISGNTSKYASAADIDLKALATTSFEIHANLPAQGAESLIVTYSAGGATAGAARIIVHYATPT